MKRSDSTYLTEYRIGRLKDFYYEQIGIEQEPTVIEVSDAKNPLIEQKEPEDNNEVPIALGNFHLNFLSKSGKHLFLPRKPGQFTNYTGRFI